jgi:hypothetical protein
MMCCIGIFVVSLIGLPVPIVAAGEILPVTSFWVTGYWRVIIGLPVVFAFFQVALMLTVFRYDTPVALKQRGDYDRLTALLSKIYQKEQV